MSVTRVLSQIDQGDSAAAEQLLPLVYDELRKLALAVGAGACGSCYWLVTAANSGMSRTVNGKGQRWESYASAQATLGQAGSAPACLLRCGDRSIFLEIHSAADILDVAVDLPLQ